MADRLQARNALFQRRVVEIGDAGLDGVIEALEPKVCLGHALVQFGDVLAAALGALLPAVKDGRQNLLETLRLEQPIRDVFGDQVLSFSIGIERPLQPASPCRALIEQV